jgi:poly-gamma-glutamate synthesis protein (capsule biosynthesis protein)
MEEYKQAGVLFVVLTALVILSLSTPTLTTSTIAFGAFDSEFVPGDMLFVGDILLGREVGRIMEREGPKYPFLHVETLLQSVDATVGNFESAIPLRYRETPDFGFALSVKQEYLQTLKDVGFDILSLANNHSMDFGPEGFLNTATVCDAGGLLCIGNPINKAESQTAIVKVGSTRVGIIALYAVNGDIAVNQLLPQVETLTRESDIQVTFIHWGDEYRPQHNDAQESIAHALIDAGIDAVFGHHPHVVQDVELYNSKPIFYSLGNFVFDQYFSDEVQTGLMVKLSIEKDTLLFTLIPVSSRGSASQPQIMNVDARNAFLQKLWESSALDIHANHIAVPK